MSHFEQTVPEENLSRAVALFGVDVVGTCGNPETLGDGSPALKLATNRPKVLIRDALPGYTRDDIWGWLKEAHARWASVCDWQATRIHDLTEMGPNDYVQLVTVADLGSSGVLADQMLPYSGGQVLLNRINSRIRWKPTDGPMQSGTVDPIRTETHETGHFMGHAHWPVGAPPELMEPTISQTVLGPQPTEARVSSGWFGEPVPVTPPVGNAESWLRRLTQDLLGRAPTQAELLEWLPLANDPMRLAVALVVSVERYGVLTDGWYEKYLRRKADPGGHANFVRALRVGTSHDHCVAVIVSSPEYRGRSLTQSLDLDPQTPTQPPPPTGGSSMREIVLQAIDFALAALEATSSNRVWLLFIRFLKSRREWLADLLIEGFGASLTAPQTQTLIGKVSAADVEALVGEMKAT